MLTELRLSNFRAFDDEVKLRVRPITILIGRNNAGKSSLIKFLLMLQQSLDPAAPEFLITDGARTHLGAFSALKHSKSRRRDLSFSLTFESSDVPRGFRDVALLMKLVEGAAVAHGSVSARDDAKLTRFLHERKSRGRVRQHNAVYTLGARLNYGQRAMSGLQHIEAVVDGAPIHRAFSRNLRRGTLLSFPAEGDSVGSSVKAFVDDLFAQPLRYELLSTQHLAPVRAESDGRIANTKPPEGIVGQLGEFALAHLQSLIASKDSRAAFVRRHLQTVAGVSDVRFRSSEKELVAHALARNAETSASAYLSQFGFGVSQCLPVIVQGTLMPPRHLMMVEQPEAQLHPTAQLAMGSFFAELWTKRQVCSLIETHSANVLLRLRHLVAKGELDPQAISVAYVYTDAKKTKINNLDVNETGTLEAGLPMEFFGQDIIEGIEMGARQ